MISEKDRCNTCEGKKTVQETKILEVPIDKGMKDGQKIPFRGEGDQVVNMTLEKKLLSFWEIVILLKHERMRTACFF